VLCKVAKKSLLLILLGQENGALIKEFSSEVINEIECYVYRLIDPRNGNTFYVGKGKGNRVFAHMNGALDFEGVENEASEKDDVSEKIGIIQGYT